MEEKIIKSLPDLKIDWMECYEPGNEQFKHLKDIDFGLENKPIMRHEAFDENTKLGNSYLATYSLIPIKQTVRLTFQANFFLKIRYV